MSQSSRGMTILKLEPGSESARSVVNDDVGGGGRHEGQCEEGGGKASHDVTPAEPK
jgi:hypothetical protein